MASDAVFCYREGGPIKGGSMIGAIKRDESVEMRDVIHLEYWYPGIDGSFIRHRWSSPFDLY